MGVEHRGPAGTASAIHRRRRCANTSTSAPVKSSASRLTREYMRVLRVVGEERVARGKHGRHPPSARAGDLPGQHPGGRDREHGRQKRERTGRQLARAEPRLPHVKQQVVEGRRAVEQQGAGDLAEWEAADADGDALVDPVGGTHRRGAQGNRHTHQRRQEPNRKQPPRACGESIVRCAGGARCRGCAGGAHRTPQVCTIRSSGSCAISRTVTSAGTRGSAFPRPLPRPMMKVPERGG